MAKEQILNLNNIKIKVKTINKHNNLQKINKIINNKHNKMINKQNKQNNNNK